MKTIKGIQAGWWVRFSEYEIRDGRICPTDGATLEHYDPWEQYGKSLTKINCQPPYQSLWELIRTLDNHPINGLSIGSETRLLEWCSEYGLLGILPHQTSVVVLPEVRKKNGDSFNSYVRCGKGWNLSITESGYKPSALIQELRENKTIWKPLGDTWTRFIPRDYPQPLTDEFWQLYGEPVTDFIDGANALIWAIRRLKERGRGNDFKLGQFTLNHLVVNISPVLVTVGGDALDEKWVAPSLLASFSMMVLQDLTDNKRFLRCSVCKAFFVSKAWQATYCSGKCRETAQKRRFRAKEKENKRGA